MKSFLPYFLSLKSVSNTAADVINIEMLHNHFNQCDTNQDGKLARDECASHWEGGNGPTFDEVDEDGDGEVSWEEMKKAATTMKPEERGKLSGLQEGIFA